LRPASRAFRHTHGRGKTLGKFSAGHQVLNPLRGEKDLSAYRVVVKRGIAYVDVDSGASKKRGANSKRSAPKAQAPGDRDFWFYRSNQRTRQRPFFVCDTFPARTYNMVSTYVFAIEMSAQNQSWRRFVAVTTAALDVDWNAVYRDELPRIYNYFRYRFGDNGLAEDLTAATFEKAWRARERYRRDLSGFSTWLLTIARNVATDHWRARRADVSLDAVREYPAPDSPHELYVRGAEIQRLGALLAQLKAHERELVALKYGAGRNNREIAKLLGMSESNVGTTLHRIVSKLRERWSEGES
jgi:RNA polymerase sigma-70 factor (ECF subfamily)